MIKSSAITEYARMWYDHKCKYCIPMFQIPARDVLSVKHHQRPIMVGSYDLYWCAQEGLTTIVARFGNEGSEYLSIPVDILRKLKDADLLNLPGVVEDMRLACDSFDPKRSDLLSRH